MRTLSKKKAFCVAGILFAVQCVSAFYVWDSEGTICYVLVVLLCVMEFPVFPLLLGSVFLPLGNESVLTTSLAWMFATYLLKFYAIALAYSILWYHVLIGHYWRWYNYALYLSLECIFLTLTMLDSRFPSARHWRLAPVEIAVSFILYRYVNGCDTFQKARSKKGRVADASEGYRRHDCHSKLPQ